jgi:hypothetical protein
VTNSFLVVAVLLVLTIPALVILRRGMSPDTDDTPWPFYAKKPLTYTDIGAFSVTIPLKVQNTKSPTTMVGPSAKTLYLDYSGCWAVNPALTVGWPRTSWKTLIRPITVDCVPTLGHCGCSRHS